MWQRRGGSADQLVGMRSTCPVRADSPLTAVCQPEKKGMREEGRKEGREKVIRRKNEKDEEEKRDCKNKKNKEDAKKREEERQSNQRYPQH